jgi:serine/threonine-protein kinase HipA
MPRRSKTSTLGVWMGGRQTGTWKVTPSRGHEFSYAESWIEDPQARPSDVVEYFFENLLPDNKKIRERLRQRFGAPSATAFDLLNEIGRDCVGALQLLPVYEKAPKLHSMDAIELDENAVAALLRNLLAPGRHNDGHEEDDEFRISIAGAQEKTALLLRHNRWHRPRGATPTSHILKLPLGIAPSGIDLSTSIENEWLCALLMQGFGLPIAKSQISTFEDQKVLVVERFDREWANADWLKRLPQEDFAQVTGTRPDQKYESDGGPGIKRIMDHLLGAQQPEDDRHRFMKTQVVFWLLCAIDGHAKNFSVFIETQGRFRLTPGYDVLSAFPVLGHGAKKIANEKAKMAMAVWGKNRHYRWSEIRRSHFVQTAKDCGMGRRSETYVDEIISETPRVIDAVGRALPKSFPAEVFEPIFEGMRLAARRLAM